MGKINVLGFDIANLIAAGEVVDRPASVVKELLENAIDSGADTVTVDIKHGGVTFIKVTDNGCGISADDLPTAILRHATSKISTAADLSNILTLGFRGEALAAIAAVVKLKIISKTADEPYGNILVSNGGEIVSLTETGCTDGTTVIAEDLFYNVPARRKFLKKDSTEAIAVSAVVEKIALSHPEIAIKYTTDGEIKFFTSGDGDLYSTIYALYGKQTAARSIKVERSDGGIRVHGYISEPDNVRSNRNMENIFINGRYVKSRTAAAALEQAYISRIPSDKFPFCVLNIELNPETVDVNVHPSKLEVKFTNERIIFDAVYYAVLSALEGQGTRPELSLGREVHESKTNPNAIRQTAETVQSGRQAAWQMGNQPPQAGQNYISHSAVDQIKKDGAPTKPQSSGAFWLTDQQARELINAMKPVGEKNTSPEKNQIRLDSVRQAMPAETMKDEAPAPVVSVNDKAPENDVPPTATVIKEAGEAPMTVPDYVIIGEAFNCYVIVQIGEKLIMIDKHAAHERILYEDMRRKMHGKEKHPQILMFPLEIQTDDASLAALDEYEGDVKGLGFDYDVDRKRKMLLVSQIPEELTRESAVVMMESLIRSLSDGTGNPDAAKAEFFDRILYRSACKAAIKGGRMYGTDQIKWVCDRVLAVPENGESAIKTCPHGRPVAFEITKNSIERQFERQK